MIRDLLTLAAIAIAVAAYRKAFMAIRETERQRQLTEKFKLEVAAAKERAAAAIAAAGKADADDEAAQKAANDELAAVIDSVATLVPPDAEPTPAPVP